MKPAKKQTMDFTKGPIVKPLLLFALPLLLGNILQQLYQITDSLIVGNILGKQALAAIGATAPITNLSIAVAIGTTLGVSVLVSQFFGAHDTENVKKTIVTTYWFFIPYAIVISIIGTIFAKQFLLITNTPLEILDNATKYLRITFLGSSCMIGYNVANAVFRGIGNAKKPLLLLVLSIILNVILDLVFLLVFKTEVWGTALATIISQGVAFACSLYFFKKEHKEFHSKIRKSMFSPHLLKRCLSIGIPSGLKGSLYWAGFVFITAIINSYGTATIAAYSIAARIDAFIQLPLLSLSHSLSTYVGQNVGAGDASRIKAGVRVSTTIGIVFSLLMTAFVFLGAEAGLRLFTNDDEVIRIGIQYLHYVSLFYLIYSLQEVVQGVAVGCGDTIILLISTLVAMWVIRVPLAFFLSARMGALGIWLSIPSGWIVAMLFSNGYYLSGWWKKRITPPTKNQLSA